MYDFSHPIADAIECISHSLCTLEFKDHRPLYYWILKKLSSTGLIKKRPQQIEFSRLNIKYSILSKRKLIQLVKRKYVNGWDDPRMPTLSGLRRRGVPPLAIRLFCEKIGISKIDSYIDDTILDKCIRDVMEINCKRAFVVLNPLKIIIKNWMETQFEYFEVPRNPKVICMGKRMLPFGKQLFIERSDFYDIEGYEGKKTNRKVPKGYKRLHIGGIVRLKHAYVISCDEVIRDSLSKEPIELLCTLYPETRSGLQFNDMSCVKGIIHWVEASTGVQCQVNQYDRLFKVEKPDISTNNFLKYFNPLSLEKLKNAIVEPSVAADILTVMEDNSMVDEQGIFRNEPSQSHLSYQFERCGYFSVDFSCNRIDNLIFNRVITIKSKDKHPKVSEE